jgi:hypothetical protein
LAALLALVVCRSDAFPLEPFERELELHAAAISKTVSTVAVAISLLKVSPQGWTCVRGIVASHFSEVIALSEVIQNTRMPIQSDSTS